MTNIGFIRGFYEDRIIRNANFFGEIDEPNLEDSGVYIPSAEEHSMLEDVYEKGLEESIATTMMVADLEDLF